MEDTDPEPDLTVSAQPSPDKPAEPGTFPEPERPDDPIEAARATLAAADPVTYYRSMAALARSTHGALLQPLDYSPKYPFHDPATVSYGPDPSTRDTMRLYANAAYPDFDKILVAAFRRPENTHLINELFHRLTVDHSNVALVTNHGEIVDIALVLAALVLALTDPERSVGVLGEHGSLPEIAPRCNVLVSRMVTTRSVFSLPAVEVISTMCRSWFSVPQTQSRRRARLDPELVRANNLLMRHGLDETLEGGGQLVAMAASGSQDLSLAANLVQRVRTTWRHRRGVEPENAPSLHLQPLYDGTINLMLKCRYVLPLAISLDPAHPACEIGTMTVVREPDDCHTVMDWIAHAHQQATGITTIYHRHEDDLLTQVRDVLRS